MTAGLIKVLKPSYGSLFLESFWGKKSLCTATGFVVMSNSLPYLITNWHVVSGRHPETRKLLSSHGVAPDRLRVRHNRTMMRDGHEIVEYPLYEDNCPLWKVHSTLGNVVDVVALPLAWPDSNQRFGFDPYDLSEPDVGISLKPTSPVSVVGYPFGISTGHGLAIWAQAFVASEPEIDYGNRPIFLADGRMRPGQSGSPVLFAKNDLVLYRDGSRRLDNDMQTEFLGVYSGRIRDDSDLGLVWKRAAVRDVAENGVLDQLDASWQVGLIAHLPGEADVSNSR